MKLGAALALVLFLLVGLLYTQVIAESGVHTVTWRDLTTRLGPVRWPREQMHAVRSRAQLERVLRKAMPRDTPEPPPMDFRRRTAVLAAVGPRSSTGYDLRVVRITEQRDRIVVVLRERAPRLGERVATRLTFPYRLITIPATEKPVFFLTEGRR